MERFEAPDVAAREMLDAWLAALRVPAAAGDEDARRRLAIVEGLRADLDLRLVKQLPPAAVSGFIARELWWRFAHVSPVQTRRHYALLATVIVLGATAVGLLQGGNSAVFNAGLGLAIVLIGYLFVRRTVPRPTVGGSADRE
jgi:hypothetical protein